MNTSERPTFRRAAATSAGLSLLFLVVYGACNAFTATRSDVGTWVYAWERHIPFVPLFIVPYLSIDLFFVAAPFLCSERHELSMLSRRIVLAIVVAAVFFLAMPLKFSFERPSAPGVLGAVFDWFRSMDKPYNQFPSLHIALRTILADAYARHTRGWKRVASDVWFSLIGASTLLTYQHHVVDVVGGFALAALCFYVFSDSPWRLAVTRTPRIAAQYLAGAIACAIVAWLTWPWGAIVLWPAVALALVAAAYLGLGPGVFRKHAGRLPWASRLVLAPVLVGQRLSRRHYARRSNAWDAVTYNVWIGRTLTPAEARDAIAAGVTAVLDLTGELPEAEPLCALPGYRNLPILDLTAPVSDHFRDGLAFIEQHVKSGGIVYVHCKAGYSRSAAVVAAYLLRSGRAKSAEEALDLIRQRRPAIIVRPEAVRAIADVSAGAVCS